jgi:uncharacterized protein
MSGREQRDDGPALEELFASLHVTADWTMGFLTAVCSGPDAIAPEVWVPEILPGASDPKKVDLLGRLRGAVVETLAGDPELIPPEPDKPDEDAVEFCRGYLRGARLHATWRADETAIARLSPLVALAKENAEPNPEEAKQRQDLGRYVADLRAYWLAKRQVVHAAPKVGRNDPCPCGSGKKHKKCCLANA